MRIADAMDLWATWQKNGSGDVRIWFPQKSVGFATGGINCWNDVELSTDAWMCEIIDTAVDGLPPAQHAAIHNRYLDAVFRFPRNNYELLLEFAIEEIIRIIRKKGVVISQE